MEYLLCDNDKVIVRYTVDDEEPSCARCEWCTDCDEKQCGPQNGWRNYSRRGLIDFSKI